MSGRQRSCSRAGRRNRSAMASDKWPRPTPDPRDLPPGSRRQGQPQPPPSRQNADARYGDARSMSQTRGRAPQPGTARPGGPSDQQGGRPYDTGGWSYDDAAESTRSYSYDGSYDTGSQGQGGPGD